MAMLDGELPDTQREPIEKHLHQCPICSTEFGQFKRLTCLTHNVHFSSPRGYRWDAYWSDVCRKMNSRANWLQWSTGALALVVIGNLMIFGCSYNPFAFVAGALALGSGFALLGVSYYCNCKR